MSLLILHGIKDIKDNQVRKHFRKLKLSVSHVSYGRGVPFVDLCKSLEDTIFIIPWTQEHSFLIHLCPITDPLRRGIVLPKESSCKTLYCCYMNYFFIIQASLYSGFVLVFLFASSPRVFIWGTPSFRIWCAESWTVGNNFPVIKSDANV